jgi:hypothetical protein
VKLYQLDAEQTRYVVTEETLNVLRDVSVNDGRPTKPLPYPMKLDNGDLDYTVHFVAIVIEAPADTPGGVDRGFWVVRANSARLAALLTGVAPHIDDADSNIVRLADYRR